MTQICLLAGNSEEAYRFARSQNLDKSQWFYPKDTKELLFRTNFHVIVVGTATGVPSSLFEKIYQLALKRGAIGRL